jgi:hypothetical protein
VYLDVGNQSISIEFGGIKIRQNEVNGTYDLRYLRLYDDDWNRLDYIRDAYTTSYYNYTEFQRPPAEFNDIYSDYGTDTDGDGLYDHFGWGIDYESSDYVYLDVGNQSISIEFGGIKIRQNEVNGTYDLKYLRLYDSSTGDRLDYIYDAYTTSYYNYTEFQRPPAEFSDIYSDYGTDTDGDGFYDYLTIEIGVDVITAGYYQVNGELYDRYGDHIGGESNYTYLNVGNQTVQLDFDGVKIRQNGVNGTYDLKYLYLYDDNWNRLDYIRDAYTTGYYEWPEWQRPPAEFNDIYSDYGSDIDGDGLYDYLIIDVGVDVITAGYYQVEGRLDDSYGDCIEYRSNYTYLNVGNQTVQLDFDGVKIRQNGVNGTYDLRYLSLRDGHWNKLDYIRDAYTTGYYEWPEWQRPPAEFNDIYSDYGSDIDGDGLYDYLIIDVGVDVITAGYYQVEGRLDDSYGDCIEYRSNYTYLSAGNQTVQLDFDGIKIRQNGVNGTYDLKYLRLYDSSTGDRLDYIYDAYTTSYYNYTEFQRPPAEFNNIYSDYGSDTDGDGFYDYLIIDVGVDVMMAGKYRIEGSLYDEYGYSIEYDSSYTYLNAGNQTVTLAFSGTAIRQHDVDGHFHLKYLQLYDENYNQLDYLYDAHTTSYYNCTDFQRISEFNGNFSDNGADTDDDGLYNNLTISVGVYISDAGYHRVSGDLYSEYGHPIGSDSRYPYLNVPV